MVYGRPPVMGDARYLFRLLPLALVGAVLPLQSLAQEVLVPNRRHDTSVFSVRVDDVRGANLTGGGVNYGKSRTMTVDLDVLTPVNNRGPILWDVGFGWKRMEFAYHVESGNPGALQAVKVPIGASWELGEVTTLGVQIQPGVYSDSYDISLGDVNVPVGIRLFHGHESDLMWMVGLQANAWHEFPVIPDIGVRWRFWYDFVLDARLPNPRLEYELSDRWTTFAGFEWLGGAYRVGRNNVASGGLPGTDDSTLTYRDQRINAGFRFAWDDESYVSLSAGYSLGRRFRYSRGGQLLKAGGALFVQLGLHLEW